MKFVRKQHEHSIIETVFRKSLRTYMLSSLTWAIGSTIDSAVIGIFLGVDSIAAYGLIWPLTLVYALIGGILSGGSRNLYSRLVGRGKTDEANHVFTLAMLLSIGISAAMMALTYLLLTPLVVLLGASGQNALLLPLASRYLGGFIIGLPFDNGAKVLSGYMGMDSDHRRIVLATTAMTVTDIAGDLAAVLLFHGGMFLLGFATAFGQMVYFAVLASHFLRRDRMLRFTLKGVTGVGEKIRTMIASGAPVGVSRLANALCGISINRILCAMATYDFIAAYSVQKTVGSLFGTVYLGIADTVWLLSGIYYGEEDRNALDKLQHTALRTGLYITCFAGVVLFLLARFVAGVFISGDDLRVLDLVTHAVRLYAVSMPLYLVVYLLNDYLMGTGKLRDSNIYSFFLEFGAVVPVAWLMVNFFGGIGVWIGLPVTLAVMVAAAFLYIQCWKTGESFHERRLLVGPKFGSSAGEELSISADTMMEIIGMSRLAGLFCKENGVDKKKAYILSLCIEELGRNILEYGFADGKSHSIDMRILVKDGELILRMRDDCQLFSLLERYQKMMREDEDPTKNIGIRMVVKTSKDIRYLSTMNTNNLIIRI